MLLEFSCTNFKSIKEKVTFSFLATKDDSHQMSLRKYGKHHVLRSAVIYGANGSGKSSFLQAVIFIRNLVMNSIHNQPGDHIVYSTHKLSHQDDLTSFDIQFVKDEIRYVYGCSLKQKKINEEYLYYFPNGKQVKIFEREDMKITPGDKYKSSFKLSYDVLKENRLFLSCVANYANLKEIERAYLFFKEDIVYYNSESNNWTEYSIEMMQNNLKIKQLFLNVLQKLGTGIKDIKSNIETISIKDLPQAILPMEIRNAFPINEVQKLNVQVQYEQFETDLFTEESNGIQRLFEVICPIIDILEHGKLLIIDEIETSLHESIVYEIVTLFKEARSEQFAQLLFSTHDTSLLDITLFRRDQIWFTQLDKHRCTDLYSLAEIKNVRKTENIRNGYIHGKYGAIPMLGGNVYSLLEDD